MALTIAKKKGPSVVGEWEEAIFSITPDNSWLAAGENADFTSYFSEIFGIEILGSTVIAGYKLGFIIPAYGTDITSSNVKMTAHYSTDAAGAMTAVPDTTDISGIGVVNVKVCGKVADPATS